MLQLLFTDLESGEFSCDGSDIAATEVDKDFTFTTNHNQTTNHCNFDERAIFISGEKACCQGKYENARAIPWILGHVPWHATYDTQISHFLGLVTAGYTGLAEAAAELCCRHLDHHCAGSLRGVGAPSVQASHAYSCACICRRSPAPADRPRHLRARKTVALHQVHSARQFNNALLGISVVPATVLALKPAASRPSFYLLGSFRLHRLARRGLLRRCCSAEKFCRAVWKSDRSGSFQLLDSSEVSLLGAG